VEQTYQLYSGRMQGWLTRTGTYSSDPAEALQLGRTAAIERCRKHKTDGGYQLLPISLNDLGDIG